MKSRLPRLAAALVAVAAAAGCSDENPVTAIATPPTPLVPAAVSDIQTAIHDARVRVLPVLAAGDRPARIALLLDDLAAGFAARDPQALQRAVSQGDVVLNALAARDEALSIGAELDAIRFIVDHARLEIEGLVMEENGRALQ